MSDYIGRATLICLACANGFFKECLQPVGDAKEACGLVTRELEFSEVPKERGGQVKTNDSVTDLESTGRKRAALAFPITEGMACEWQGLAKAGGGVKPIIGCLEGNFATNIHHGPNKSTLANVEGNVHRICSKCHNRWHASNDEFYGKRPSGGEPYIPKEEFEWLAHNPSLKALDKDIISNEIMYSIRKDRR